jgi:hypothetical protein
MIKKQNLECRTNLTTVGVMIPRADPIGGTAGMSVEPQPNFQTYPRWVMSMESEFIQKLIEGKCLAHFHLARNILLPGIGPAFPETDLLWVIVDGQQRYWALFHFFKDDVPLPKGFTLGVDDEVIDLGGKRWSYIRDNYPEIRDYILNIAVPIVEYAHFEAREQITDQFDLLNRGVKLNGAEVRHAWEGKIGKFVDDIAKMPFFKLNMYGMSNSRMMHLEMVEKSLALADLNLSRDVSKKSLDEWRRTEETNFKPRGKEANLVREFYEKAVQIWGVEGAAKPQIKETTAIFVLWLRNRAQINKDVTAFGRELARVNKKRLEATDLSGEPLTPEQRLAVRFNDRNHPEEHHNIIALVVAYEDCLKVSGVLK